MKMTRRHGLALLFMALLMLPVAAQQQFTLEDLNFGGKNYRNMIPKNHFSRLVGRPAGAFLEPP